MCVCVLLLLVAAMPALAGTRVPLADPAFAQRQQAAVLARVGDSAALRCRVLRLADRVVSWVRSSDLQILTHAGYVFTADSRVSCSEAPASRELAEVAEGAEATEEPYDDLTSRDEGWQGVGSVHTLRIERLREADSGRYECQINTEPKLSFFFNLTVVAEASLPTVRVRALGGGGGVRGVAGGAARLACEARYEPAPGPELQAALPPLKIRWTHEGETLDPQSPRGGISLDSERWPARAVSRLTLAALSARDAGRYQCAAAGHSAALRLRIQGLDDDYQIAEEEGEMERMQHDQAVARVSAATRHSWAALPLLLLLLLAAT